MPSDQSDGRVQTIGATTAIVATIPIGPSRAGFVEAWTVGRDDLGNGCMFKLAAAGRTNAANPPIVTAIGAPAITASRADAGLAAATSSITVSPGQIELRATGVVGRMIQWTGELVLFVSA